MPLSLKKYIQGSSPKILVCTDWHLEEAQGCVAFHNVTTSDSTAVFSQVEEVFIGLILASWSMMEEIPDITRNQVSTFNAAGPDHYPAHFTPLEGKEGPRWSIFNGMNKLEQILIKNHGEHLLTETPRVDFVVCNMTCPLGGLYRLNLINSCLFLGRRFQATQRQCSWMRWFPGYIRPELSSS